ncbi:MAG TPA: cell division protein ZapA [Clostridia bacterium]|nr:cell division protein ZapA [Clostridia bacterium]
MSQSNGSIRVEIYDQTYNLRGSDAEYIQMLASIVDAKMRAVAEHTSTVDSLRVAVLAALNIADEYITLKTKYESVSSEYTERASHLRNALDSALNEVMADRRVG